MSSDFENLKLLIIYNYHKLNLDFYYFKPLKAGTISY